MNLAHQPHQTPDATPPNFATVGHSALTKLIAAFDAAEKRYEAASKASDAVANPDLSGPASRAAKTRLSRAELALEKAELKLVDYRPANASEAVTLLRFASRGQGASCFTCEQYDLHAIMENVAAAIAGEA
jgi:hypothetical protein